MQTGREGRYRRRATTSSPCTSVMSTGMVMSMVDRKRDIGQLIRLDHESIATWIVSKTAGSAANCIDRPVR